MRKMRRDEFDAIYVLMELSFPEDEFRPYEEQKALLENPLYTVYVEAGEDNSVFSEEKPDDAIHVGQKVGQEKILAFLTVYNFPGFTFAEHFAVSPAARNQGLGSKMLTALKKQLPRRICLEVELPLTEQAGKRIGFYERNGFSLNDYPYVQPPISRGRKPVPLRLMTTGGPLEEEEFQRIQKVLMREVYHVEE